MHIHEPTPLIDGNNPVAIYCLPQLLPTFQIVRGERIPLATAGFTKRVPHGRVLGLIDGNLIQKAIATEVECCLPLVFNMGCFSRYEGHLMVCPLPRPRCLLPGPLRDDVGHVPFGRLDHIGGVAIMVF